MTGESEADEANTVPAGPLTDSDTEATIEATIEAVPTVTVYWRPGCPFCGSLRRGLRRSGLTTQEIDIWSDPAAAAFVRLHAGGNETVPTVDIAGTVLVNPSPRQVLDEAAAAGVTVSAYLRRWWKPSGA